MKTSTLVVIIFTLFFSLESFGQDNKELALEKAREAIQLMDNGKIDESIKLLNESQKLDPDRFDYPYEIAYAYYLKEDYKKVIKILEELKSHNDVSERLFQMLGNCYDILEKQKKAFEIYDAGLMKFPRSGMLHLEKGNVHWNNGEYGEALKYYEKGIELNPQFPSNYYRAALIYCGSTEEVWGMLYGEIFMNLERNTKRTAEISKLLYDTYMSQIKISSDSSISVSFCKNMNISMEGTSKQKNPGIPFGMIYEPTLLMSIISIDSVDLSSLDLIRQNFVRNYFKMGHNKTHPNILFDYQKKILDAGHMEAYNHWILMKGNEDLFSEWYDLNQEKWNLFADWFSQNGLILNKEQRFHSGQY